MVKRRSIGSRTFAPAVLKLRSSKPDGFSNSCPKPEGFLKFRPRGPSHLVDSRSCRNVVLWCFCFGRPAHRISPRGECDWPKGRSMRRTKFFEGPGGGVPVEASGDDLTRQSAPPSPHYLVPISPIWKNIEQILIP